MPPRSCSKNSAPKQSNQSEKLTSGSAHCSDKVREKGVAGKQGSREAGGSILPLIRRTFCGEGGNRRVSA